MHVIVYCKNNVYNIYSEMLFGKVKEAQNIMQKGNNFLWK